ncbi:MAG: TraR/DksA family transcriptional regulator [Desulfobacteraceae bacterium]|jgi:DnaK suppressor protein
MKTREKKSQKKTENRVNKGVTKKTGRSRGGKESRANKEETDLRATFMQNILDKRKELERTLEHLIESQKEYDVQLSGGDLIDELDQAQREISASSYYPIIERKTKELRKIDRLIKRMSKEGKFGLCEECGKQIPKKRLLIVPEATLCVPCQRELERIDLQRSFEARDATGYGGGQGKDWNSDRFDEKGHRALKTQMNTFSVNEIRGTEADNDFPQDVKRH